MIRSVGIPQEGVTVESWDGYSFLRHSFREDWACLIETSRVVSGSWESSLSLICSARAFVSASAKGIGGQKFAQRDV